MVSTHCGSCARYGARSVCSFDGETHNPGSWCERWEERANPLEPTIEHCTHLIVGDVRCTKPLGHDGNHQCDSSLAPDLARLKIADDAARATQAQPHRCSSIGPHGRRCSGPIGHTDAHRSGQFEWGWREAATPESGGVIDQALAEIAKLADASPGMIQAMMLGALMARPLVMREVLEGIAAQCDGDRNALADAMMRATYPPGPNGAAHHICVHGVEDKPAAADSESDAAIVELAGTVEQLAGDARAARDEQIRKLALAVRKLGVAVRNAKRNNGSEVLMLADAARDTGDEILRELGGAEVADDE